MSNKQALSSLQIDTVSTSSMAVSKSAFWSKVRHYFYLSRQLFHTNVLEKIILGKSQTVTCSQDRQKYSSHKGELSPNTAHPLFLCHVGFWQIFPHIHYSVGHSDSSDRQELWQSLFNLSFLAITINRTPSGRMRPAYRINLTCMPSESWTQPAPNLYTNQDSLGFPLGERNMHHFQK